MHHIPSYFIARRIAADRDWQGIKPNLAMRLTTGIATLAAMGALACAAIAVLDFLAWEAGLIG